VVSGNDEAPHNRVGKEWEELDLATSMRCSAITYYLGYGE
jgi:hypothetical protein